MKTTRERFDEKTERDETTGCLIWTAAKSRGYGTFWNGEKLVGAHRWNYEATVGPIPEGHDLDHVICATPACVEPAHLEPVTPRENTLRQAARLTGEACRRGHRWDEQVPIVKIRDGIERRECRVCDSDARRSRYRADPEKYRARSRDNRRKKAEADG